MCKIHIASVTLHKKEAREIGHYITKLHLRD